RLVEAHGLGDERPALAVHLPADPRGERLVARDREPGGERLVAVPRADAVVPAVPGPGERGDQLAEQIPLGQIGPVEVALEALTARPQRGPREVREPPDGEAR